MTTTTRPAGTQARQQHLLRCAIDVVGRSGLRGLTHRAVDREAELPEGTCSVYYRTRLALLTALTEFVSERLARDVARLAETLPDRGDQDGLVEATTALLLGWSRQPELLVTVGDLTMEAVRTPSLRDEAGGWRDRLVDIVERIVCRQQRTSPRLRAQAVVASLEGVALSALVYPEDDRERYLRGTITMVLSGLAAAEGE